MFLIPNSAGARGNKPFWLLLTASLLILSFGRLLSSSLGPYGSVVLVCCTCLISVWVVRISTLQFDVAHVLLLFVAHYFLMFGLYGFMNAFGLSHYLGVSYETGSDSPAAISSLASVYSAGLLLAALAGFARQTRSAKGTAGGFARSADASPDFKMLHHLRVAALIALMLGYAGCALMIYFLGGTRVIGLDPSYVSTEGSHGLYWAQALVSANHWAFIVNLFSFVRAKRLKYLGLACLSVPLFLIDFILSGSKSGVILPVVSFLIVRHYCHRRVNWRTAAVLVAVFLVVFAAGYTYRSTGAEASQFGQGMASYYQNPLAIVDTFVGRFYGTDSFAMVLDSVNRGQPLLMGGTLKTLFTWFIPRWIYPEKPVSFALAFGEMMMPSAPGAGGVYYAPSLPGEMYLNFGWLGLLFGGLLVGYCLRFVYRKLIEVPPLKIESVILYATIAPLIAAVSEGPVAGIIEFVLTRLILYWGVIWIAGLFPAPVPRPLVKASQYS